MRWRSTSHQGRRCRRKRALSTGESVRQISWKKGRNRSTTGRKSSPLAVVWRASIRRDRARSGRLPGSAVATLGRLGILPARGLGGARCRGNSPRRESAWIGPQCPWSRSDITASTIVRPVPISRAAASAPMPASAPGDHGSRRCRQLSRNPASAPGGGSGGKLPMASTAGSAASRQSPSSVSVNPATALDRPRTSPRSSSRRLSFSGASLPRAANSRYRRRIADAARSPALPASRRWAAGASVRRSGGAGHERRSCAAGTFSR